MVADKIGHNLRKLRESHGLTLSEFADIIGLSSSTISLIENGKRQLTVANLKRICKEFHIKADKILFGE
jgi:HTH-type transcriptional regulator/antitoxin PezA